jgi:hypothetical protein
MTDSTLRQIPSCSMNFNNLLNNKEPTTLEHETRDMYLKSSSVLEHCNADNLRWWAIGVLADLDMYSKSLSKQK